MLRSYFQSARQKLPLVIAVVLLVSFALPSGTAAAQSTLEKIKASKTMVAGNSGSYPPFEMMEGNKLVGFDADLAEELGKRMGLTIKFEIIDFKGIIAALTSGRVDVLISAVTKTPERAERISFSEPYYNAGIGALYLESTPIKTPDDLKGRVVGVQLGSSGELFVRQKLGDSVKEVKSLKRQITEQTDTRDDLTKLAKNHIVRARKGVLAHFGTDSTEYAQVGGTRASERKRPGRKSGSTNAKKAA